MEPSPSTSKPTTRSGGNPDRSRAMGRMASGQTSTMRGLADAMGRNVSGSRWSVCPCEAVMTSMSRSIAGSTTRPVIRTCGLSVPAYFRVRESDR